MTPFPVLDESGRAYDHPFLGGFNIPRPQWIDIDADGDLDLFVQESSDRVSFFEAVRPVDRGPGHARAALPSYVWRTDRYADLSVGEWYRFADVDGDGDFDLLAEQPFSRLRLYRNEGTPRAASFPATGDTLRDERGVPLFSDRQNIPNAADLDCNGRLDLLIGHLTGSASRFEETGPGPDGVPRFRLVTDEFEGISIVRQFGSLHGANTLALADIDGDGDLDLFWGDFFEPGLLMIENTGSCEHPSLRGAPLPFPPDNPVRTSGYNAPTFGDVDGDGDLDLLMGVIGGAYNPNRTTVDNLYFLEQRAGGRFVERTRRFLSMIDVGSESVPALADLDGDGDLDLVISNQQDPRDLNTSRLYRYLNRGSPASPSFRLDGSLDIRGSYRYAPAFGDLDGDGDPDLVLGSWRSTLALYRNDGTRSEPRFVPADTSLVKLTRGSNGTPALVDIDADGDLDLFVGESSGTLNFYRNEGSPASPAFVLVSDRFDGIDVGRRSAPAFVDLDGDGDPDLVVGTESAGIVYFRNEGTAAEAAFVEGGALRPDAPGLASPAFGDIDGDGDADLFTGGVGGGLMFYENRGTGVRDARTPERGKAGRPASSAASDSRPDAPP
ncbi:MAG: FG-GAP repeat domain-containing protein [Gemmatimonadota bacterium]